jgi:DNA (cytosine-5)-methyltransferase 1
MTDIRYLSLFDGIGAAHEASKGLGWRCVALAEIEAAPSAVTANHWPKVPNLGDVTAHDFIDRVAELGGVDMVVGGSPCQPFSLAGLRKGLNDDRGNLTLRFVEICDAVGPAGEPVDVIFWENVPGVLSDKGNAFGCFLAALVGEDTAIVPPRGKWTNAGMVVGPQRKVAWRIIDAQGFVPQRRRRVFVVATRHRCGVDPSRVLHETEAEALRHLGDRAGAGPLFPERQGLRGHPAPGGSAGAGVASDAVVGVALRGREGGGTAEITGNVMPALRTGGGGGDKPHVLAFGGNNTGGGN